jgi:hypothetical protein
MWTAILAAISAALNAWRQEREIYNKPEMVKNALELRAQEAQDKLNAANAVLANPNATPEQHAEALRTIRLAHS